MLTDPVGHLAFFKGWVVLNFLLLQLVEIKTFPGQPLVFILTARPSTTLLSGTVSKATILRLRKFSSWFKPK